MTDTRAERAREVMPEDIALLIAKHYAATPDTRRMLQSDIYKALTAFAAAEVALALKEADWPKPRPIQDFPDEWRKCQRSVLLFTYLENDPGRYRLEEGSWCNSRQTWLWGNHALEPWEIPPTHFWELPRNKPPLPRSPRGPHHD